MSDSRVLNFLVDYDSECLEEICVEGECEKRVLSTSSAP